MLRKRTNTGVMRPSLDTRSGSRGSAVARHLAELRSTVPKSPLGKALTYLSNQQEPLETSVAGDCLTWRTCFAEQRNLTETETPVVTGFWSQEALSHGHQAAPEFPSPGHS